ncbi:MAG: isoprenylcysteine carboxylmethyltransferase family protein [Phycisphaerae bacterium]
MLKISLHRGNLRDVIIVLSLLSALSGQFHLSNGCLGFAVAAIVAGCVFRYLTKATLIRDEVLCSQGVYQLVRHPYYLGNFIIDAALILLSGNIILVFLYPFLFFWAYGPTFQKEEVFLSEKFPADYARFLLSTPQVLPSSHARPGFRRMLQFTSRNRVTRTEWGRIASHGSAVCLILLAHRLVRQGLWTGGRQAVDALALSLGAGALILFVMGFWFQRTHWKSGGLLSELKFPPPPERV